MEATTWDICIVLTLSHGTHRIIVCPIGTKTYPLLEEAKKQVWSNDHVTTTQANAKNAQISHYNFPNNAMETTIDPTVPLSYAPSVAGTCWVLHFNEFILKCYAPTTGWIIFPGRFWKRDVFFSSSFYCSPLAEPFSCTAQWWLKFISNPHCKNVVSPAHARYLATTYAAQCKVNSNDVFFQFSPTSVKWITLQQGAGANGQAKTVPKHDLWFVPYFELHFIR